MRRNKTKIFIGVLLIMALLLVGIYATFAQKLATNTVRTSANAWEIGFTNVIKSEVHGNAKEIKPVNFTENSAVFNIYLTVAGDKLAYNFTIKNKGTLDAKVESISVIPANQADDVVLFEVSGLNPGDVLNVGESAEMRVTASFNPKHSGTSELKKSATVVVNYVQK